MKVSSFPHEYTTLGISLASTICHYRVSTDCHYRFITACSVNVSNLSVLGCHCWFSRVCTFKHGLPTERMLQVDVFNRVSTVWRYWVSVPNILCDHMYLIYITYYRCKGIRIINL